MSILVTGGAGYIGSHIALALLDDGSDVVVADNLSTGLRALVPAGAAFERVDLRDREKLADLMVEYGVEAVIHCAASTVVPDSVMDPLGYYENNILGTLTLLQAMQAGKVRRLIFSSTAAVYNPEGRSLISEHENPDPVSPYGASKLMAERMVRDMAVAGDVDFTILRYFNVAGADPMGRSGQSTPAATHLIKVAAEVACGARSTLTIFGTEWPTPDGTGVRDYVHVSDLAQAHISALKSLDGPAHNSTLNCGYGRGSSVRDVIHAVERATGEVLPVNVAPARPGDLAEVVADARALRRALNWKPQYDDLDVIVRHSLEWESKRMLSQLEN
ncbi:UDP-glucose 4-epimerase GalE [Thioalkalivibrio sp. ALMg11]|uniref:UDP-glucose 4-epimerase GalE n=1 Tax=Thioalkalivibrio sp. ALMg11 TaxID=1158165 RepID=UPI0009D93440|nr:UDP-glucose 4-epimerase GalE [Thioalkalivibrio sp. ALMg11]